MINAGWAVEYEVEVTFSKPLVRDAGPHDDVYEDGYMVEVEANTRGGAIDKVVTYIKETYTDPSGFSADNYIKEITVR